jgi:integrase
MGSQIVRGDELAARPATAYLVHKVEEYAARSRAESTVRAYTSDWRDFEGFCGVHGLDPLPASPSAVALYLVDLAERSKPSTIARRTAAISVVHKRAGHPSPTADPQVQEVTRGIRRRLGAAQREATPAGTGEVRRMVAHLPKTLLGTRDAAVLLVGLASALRASELVALAVGDIEHREEGLVLISRRSKTDQEGVGRRVALPFGRDPHTCPVTTLNAWLEAAEISEGPIFRAVDRHGNVSDRGLTTKAVSLVVQRSAAAAGIEGDFSAHSLRAGFATSAAANGASERSIAAQTGHTSMEVLRRYIRHASVFTDNAVSALGL